MSQRESRHDAIERSTDWLDKSSCSKSAKHVVIRGYASSTEADVLLLCYVHLSRFVTSMFIEERPRGFVIFRKIIFIVFAPITAFKDEQVMGWTEFQKIEMKTSHTPCSLLWRTSKASSWPAQRNLRSTWPKKALWQIGGDGVAHAGSFCAWFLFVVNSCRCVLLGSWPQVINWCKVAPEVGRLIEKYWWKSIFSHHLPTFCLCQKSGESCQLCCWFCFVLVLDFFLLEIETNVFVFAGYWLHFLLTWSTQLYSLSQSRCLSSFQKFTTKSELVWNIFRLGIKEHSCSSKSCGYNVFLKFLLGHWLYYYLSLDLIKIVWLHVTLQ